MIVADIQSGGFALGNKNKHLLQTSRLCWGPRFLVLACVGLLCGCGSTKVTDSRNTTLAVGKPSMIYVSHFELGAATLKADPHSFTGRPRLIHFGSKTPAETLQHLSDLLESSLVADLKDKNLPAQRLSPGERPASGWIVTGQFLEVNEGNRLQNAVIGFGVGSADTKLAVSVEDASLPAGQNLLDFNLDSKNSKAPGGGAAAIVTHSPYGMAAKFILDRKATDKDVKRAAGEIANQLQKLVAGTSIQHQ